MSMNKREKKMSPSDFTLLHTSCSSTDIEGALCINGLPSNTAIPAGAVTGCGTGPVCLLGPFRCRFGGGARSRRRR